MPPDRISSDKRASLLKAMQFLGLAQHSSREIPVTSTGSETPEPYMWSDEGRKCRGVWNRTCVVDRTRPVAAVRDLIL